MPYPRAIGTRFAPLACHFHPDHAGRKRSNALFIRVICDLGRGVRVEHDKSVFGDRNASVRKRRRHSARAMLRYFPCHVP